MVSDSVSWRGVLIVSVASLFYCYEFFLRVAPSVLSHAMMQSFHVSAAPFSVMASSFFLVYAPMQIPAGLWTDRLGPRLSLSMMIALCALASFGFVYSTHMLGASVARGLMGFGASFAYIAPLILAAYWLPSHYFASIAGLIQALGCLGAVLGTTLIAHAAVLWGWQKPFVWGGYLGLILAVTTYLVVRDAPHEKTDNTSKTPVIKQLTYVLSQPALRWIAMIGFACWAPMSIFTELWGPPFLEQAEHISATQAAAQTAYTWLGVAIGGPLLGYLSTARRHKTLLLSLLLSLVTSATLIYATPHQTWLIESLLFLLGFGCAGQAITFGLVRDHTPLHCTGTAIGFNNMAVIFGGIALQPLTGYLLDHFWDGTLYHATPHYHATAYHFSFIPIPLCILWGLYATYRSRSFSANKPNV